MVSTKTTLALVAAFMSKTVLPAPVPSFTVTNSTATSTTTPLQRCDDLSLGSATSTSGRLCLEPLFSDELLAQRYAANPIRNHPHPNLTGDPVLTRRYESYRSTVESLMDGSKLWCAKPSRGAPQPRQQDVQTLCHNLPSSIIVPRNNLPSAPSSAVKDSSPHSAYNKLATCRIFDFGTARYRVCNLDECSEQTFIENQKICFRLNNRCPKRGMLSGYVVGKDQAGRGKAMALTGTRMMGDYAFEHNDDVFFLEQFESTCVAA